MLKFLRFFLFFLNLFDIELIEQFIHGMFEKRGHFILHFCRFFFFLFFISFVRELLF